METQFQISKGSSSNTKSNGNSSPDLKRKPQQYEIKCKLNSRSQKEAPAILNQMENQFQISKGSSSNTKSNGNSTPGYLGGVAKNHPKNCPPKPFRPRGGLHTNTGSTLRLPRNLACQVPGNLHVNLADCCGHGIKPSTHKSEHRHGAARAQV